MSGIPVPVVQQEFVNAQIPGLPFRFSQLLAIDGVKLLQPLLVNLLDCVLPKAGKHCHRLVGKSPGKQVTGSVVQSIRYPVAWSLEPDVLVFGRMAFRTAELVMLNAYIGECSAYRYMTEMNIALLVAVHPASAFAD